MKKIILMILISLLTVSLLSACAEDAAPATEPSAGAPSVPATEPPAEPPTEPATEAPEEDPTEPPIEEERALQLWYDEDDISVSPFTEETLEAAFSVAEAHLLRNWAGARGTLQFQIHRLAWDVDQTMHWAELSAQNETHPGWTLEDYRANLLYLDLTYSAEYDHTLNPSSDAAYEAVGLLLYRESTDSPWQFEDQDPSGTRRAMSLGELAAVDWQEGDRLLAGYRLDNGVLRLYGLADDGEISVTELSQPNLMPDAGSAAELPSVPAGEEDLYAPWELYWTRSYAPEDTEGYPFPQETLEAALATVEEYVTEHWATASGVLTFQIDKLAWDLDETRYDVAQCLASDSFPGWTQEDYFQNLIRINVTYSATYDSAVNPASDRTMDVLSLTLYRTETEPEQWTVMRENPEGTKRALSPEELAAVDWREEGRLLAGYRLWNGTLQLYACNDAGEIRYTEIAP